MQKRAPLFPAASPRPGCEARVKAFRPTGHPGVPGAPADWAKSLYTPGRNRGRSVIVFAAEYRGQKRSRCLARRHPAARPENYAPASVSGAAGKCRANAAAWRPRQKGNSVNREFWHPPGPAVFLERLCPLRGRALVGGAETPPASFRPARPSRVPAAGQHRAPCCPLAAGRNPQAVLHPARRASPRCRRFAPARRPSAGPPRAAASRPRRARARSSLRREDQRTFPCRKRARGDDRRATWRDGRSSPSLPPPRRPNINTRRPNVNIRRPTVNIRSGVLPRMLTKKNAGSRQRSRRGSARSAPRSSVRCGRGEIHPALETEQVRHRRRRGKCRSPKGHAEGK